MYNNSDPGLLYHTNQIGNMYSDKFRLNLRHRQKDPKKKVLIRFRKYIKFQNQIQSFIN